MNISKEIEAKIKKFIQLSYRQLYERKNEIDIRENNGEYINWQECVEALRIYTELNEFFGSIDNNSSEKFIQLKLINENY